MRQVMRQHFRDLGEVIKMSLMLTYKNELGTVTMHGFGQAFPLRITAIEGLGLVHREYNSAVYAGYDGQETLDSRA